MRSSIFTPGGIFTPAGAPSAARVTGAGLAAAAARGLTPHGALVSVVVIGLMGFREQKGFRVQRLCGMC
jgi:hypothetical protein